jgi:hypothetical protein
MAYERIEHDSTLFAEMIWAGTTAEKTRFFSQAESSLQFGLLVHEAGFVEQAHYHHPMEREISDVQQMFVVQHGVVAIDLFTPDGVNSRGRLEDRRRHQSRSRRALCSGERRHAVREREAGAVLRRQTRQG